MPSPSSLSTPFPLPLFLLFIHPLIPPTISLFFPLPFSSFFYSFSLLSSISPISLTLPPHPPPSLPFSLFLYTITRSRYLPWSEASLNDYRMIQGCLALSKWEQSFIAQAKLPSHVSTHPHSHQELFMHSGRWAASEGGGIIMLYLGTGEGSILNRPFLRPTGRPKL